MQRGGRVGEYITDLDMATYLNYVVSTQPLKGVPAFDSQGVLGGRASGENEEFGDAAGSSVNFTEYGAAAGGEVRQIDFVLSQTSPLRCFTTQKSHICPPWQRVWVRLKSML